MKSKLRITWIAVCSIGVMIGDGFVANGEEGFGSDIAKITMRVDLDDKNFPFDVKNGKVVPIGVYFLIELDARFEPKSVVLHFEDFSAELPEEYVKLLDIRPGMKIVVLTFLGDELNPGTVYRFKMPSRESAKPVEITLTQFTRREFEFEVRLPPKPGEGK